MLCKYTNGKKTSKPNCNNFFVKSTLFVFFSFNSVSTTGLRAALKRASDIINKKYDSMYNIPTMDLIESVVNTSGGDVRSAILNLHFASLKGKIAK